ncbi:MAG TPA: TonB-dependent receptor [Pyrinomonadaceae bacterium]|nr:TonB-dependent receptor [Pyrinomonadaceae bacterium]
MKRLVATTLMTALLAVAAFAQSSSGRLAGVVSGPDGVIPGATVVARDNATGREQTVTASGEGSFVFPQLEVGMYTVTVTATGFKTFVANEVKIDVGREYSLAATLEVGAVSETVEVTAGADVINATSPTLSNTVSPQQVKELPLVSRNPLNLINLQAGTSGTQGFQGTTINGMRTTMTNITRDGINIQDAFIRTNATDFAPGRPSVDDTGEFTISTGLSDSDAGYGGAQVRLVTPRGQSDFHGALFAFNRNSYFAANSFFNNRAGSFGPNSTAVLQGRARAGDPISPRPFRNRNAFGGSFSGPSFLPRFGEGGPSIYRDKAFFFFNYEGLRDPVSATATRTILTPSARAGTFTFNAACTAATCPAGVTPGQTRTVNILDFARSLGFADIPSTIDPVVQSRIIAGLPEQGNRTDIGDQLNTTGFQISRASNQTRNQYTFRFDVDANERNQATLVWSWNKELNLRPDVDTNGYGTQPAVDQTSENRTLALAYRSVFTPNLINEVRGGFFKSVVPFNRLIPRPDFFITPTLVTSPETQFLDQGRRTASYNIQDNADYTRGNHSFKFGGVFQFFQVDAYNDAATVPAFTLGTGGTAPIFTAGNFSSLGSISTAQLGTANGLLALLGGIVTSGTRSFNTTSPTSGFVPGATTFTPFRYENHSLYVQDRWRVRPDLSLTLGLRYELFPALRLDNGIAIEPLIPDGTDPVQAILNPQGRYTLIGTNAGKQNAYHKTDYKNFAPTVGFAWSPNFKNKFLGMLTGGEGRTTIRGGYGIIYANDSLVTTLNNAAVGNVGLGRTPNAALNPSGQSQLNFRLQNGVPAINPPTFIDPNSRTFIGNNAPGIGNNFGTVFAVDPGLKTPMVQQYSFGIQREVGFQTALEIRYVGTKSDNLWRSIDYNQVNIIDNGFLAEFERARANLALTGNAFCTAAGCQPLTIFQSGGTPTAGRLVVGTGGLAAATFNSRLQNGIPADLAIDFVSGGFNNHPNVANPTRAPFVNFLPNPGTGVANLFTNGASYRYDSLQVEARRRFSQGLYFQANYTFSKNLTDAIGTSQQLVEPFLDINRPQLEKARADFDITHVFNVNSIYELPFGRGKRFFSGANGVVDRIIGGFQINTIVSLASGPPITFTDARGTFNRAGRSARQGVTTSLTGDQIRDLVGFYDTPCGLFYINPSVLNINLTDCTGTGRASEGFGTTPFPGQVFFNNQPGSVGNLGRSIVSGPGYFNVDASLIKNIRITEGSRLQLRMEAYNALNKAHFFPANFINDIGSTNFGRITQTGGNSTGPGGARVMQFGARFEF